MHPSSFTILAAALATEGLLVIVSYIFAGLTDTWPVWNASWQHFAVGVALALPLLVINHVLWLLSRKRPHSVYARFSREVVVPLCRQVSIPLAALIALASGFGEEIFFRGVLSLVAAEYLGPLVAALISSLLFAYVHFIGTVARFGGMIPLYSLVGLYLWLAARESNSLFVVFVTHASYNFLAIIWVQNTHRNG